MYSSSVDDDVALAGRDGERHDLVLEPAGLLRRLGLVLRGERESVLLLAADLPFGGDVLGRVAHVIAVEGVDQPVLAASCRRISLRPSSRRRADRRHAGASDIDSWPPATMICGVAVGDLLQAERHRAQAEPQTWLRPKAVFSCGTPAFIAAWRAGFWPCAAARIWPRMTSSTSAASTLRSSSAALTTTAPSSWAGVLAKAPLNEPTAVRAALTMTMSLPTWSAPGRREVRPIVSRAAGSGCCIYRSLGNRRNASRQVKPIEAIAIFGCRSGESSTYIVESGALISRATNPVSATRQNAYRAFGPPGRVRDAEAIVMTNATRRSRSRNTPTVASTTRRRAPM